MHWRKISSARYLTLKTLRHPFAFLLTKNRGATQSFRYRLISLYHICHASLIVGITQVTLWKGSHNSTVPNRSRTTGLPPVFGRACASFIFHHAGLGSSDSTLNFKATRIAREQYPSWRRAFCATTWFLVPVLLYFQFSRFSEEPSKCPFTYRGKNGVLATLIFLKIQKFLFWQN